MADPAHSPTALITGAPRSGTSALVRWLGTQPWVCAVPETRVLISAFRFLAEAGRWKVLDDDRERLTDHLRRMVFGYVASRWHCSPDELALHKEPLEPTAFPHLRFTPFLNTLRRLFPEMKIVFMVREPVATVLSMRRRKWGYSRTQGKPRRYPLDVHVRAWCAAVDCLLEFRNDPLTEVCLFSDLVNDPERESARLQAFLKLAAGSTFLPRATTPPDADESTVASIVEGTAGHVRRLAEAGVVLS